MKKDIVKITCGGSVRTMERNKAIDFFWECICGSDGSERSRYLDIYEQLRAGCKNCSDEY